MLSVILRYTGTKQFAGLYAAKDEYDLYDLIDQEHTASDYEYAVVPTGFGIEFRKGGYRTVKYKIGGGGKALTAAFAKADYIYLTGEVAYALTTGEGLKWRGLFQD